MYLASNDPQRVICHKNQPKTYYAELSSRPFFCFSAMSTQLEVCCESLCEALPQQSAQPLAGAPVTECISSVYNSRLTLFVSHVDILTYPFITQTHFRSTTRDEFRLFSQVCPVQKISDWRLGQGSICSTSASFFR